VSSYCNQCLEMLRSGCDRVLPGACVALSLTGACGVTFCGVMCVCDDVVWCDMCVTVVVRARVFMLAGCDLRPDDLMWCV
jgi:hypothetical protein